MAPAQPFPAAPNTLAAGTTLPAGGTLVSPNRLTQLAMQGDGNLVVERTGDGTTSRYVLWSAHTHSPGARLSMQGDGNLVIYSAAGTAVWNTHTNGAGSDSRLNGKTMATLSATPVDTPAGSQPLATSWSDTAR